MKRLLGTNTFSRRNVLLPMLLSLGCRQGRRPIRIVVGGQTDLVYLPTTLARELGDFAAHDVSVEIEDTGAGSKSLQAVLGGSAEVATGFYDHALHMATQGRDIRAFLTLTRCPGMVLVASARSAGRIGRIGDLRGANVGVTAPGSSSHFFLSYLLSRHGVAKDDVSVVAMGTGRNRLAAIENGKVDAGVLLEPAVTHLLRRAPESVILADTRTPEQVRQLFGVEEYPSAVLYATGEWLQNYSESARKLARAVRQTLRWIHDHTAAEVAARMPSAFLGEDVDGYTAALERSKTLYSADGVMRRDAAEAVRRVLSLDMERVADVDVMRTYTNQFAQEP